MLLANGEEMWCIVDIEWMTRSFQRLSFLPIHMVITLRAQASHVIRYSDLKDIGYDDSLEMMARASGVF